jgi:hypothetical protein
METTDSPVAVWFRANVATRLVGPLMRRRSVRERVVQLFAQTWIRYPGSPIVSGPHAGDRVEPGVVPADLHHHLIAPDEESLAGAAATLVNHPLDLRVHLRPAAGPTVCLVRPDGHIGYAGPAASLPAYLDRVYGQ